MTKFIAAALALAFAAPVLAQDHDHAAHAAATLTVDAPIEALAADAKGKAILDAEFPGITAHPMYDSFKAMSLKQVAPMSNGVVTDEKIAKVAAGLAAK
jgi:hypothetical protein